MYSHLSIFPEIYDRIKVFKKDNIVINKDDRNELKSIINFYKDNEILPENSLNNIIQFLSTEFNSENESFNRQKIISFLYLFLIA